MRAFSIFAVTLLTSVFAVAGGTLPTEEAIEKVCEEDSSKCELLKLLPLGPVASGLRDREGYRHMPFEFLTEDNQNLVTVDRTDSGAITIKIETNSEQ